VNVSEQYSPVIFTPDTNDPTAGRVAISRELASEQIRLIADPAPLGLGAFALTTFLLSLANAGIMPAAAEPVVFGVALAYGGLAQLLAGMWEFRKSNVFGATVFTSYGAFWLSFWAYVTFFAAKVPVEQHGVAAGWFLLAWAIFTTLMLVGALGFRCPPRAAQTRTSRISAPPAGSAGRQGTRQGGVGKCGSAQLSGFVMSPAPIRPFPPREGAVT
jgi:hypothetical protein